MQYSHPQIRQIARRIPILCALYFVLFAFGYLLLLQCDVLAQTHFALSQGQAYYQPLPATILSTLLLFLLGLLLSRLLTWLPLRLKAAVWFPSFFLLGLLTSWHFPSLGDPAALPRWPRLLLPVGLYLLLLVLGRLHSDSSKERDTFSTYAWPNALLLVLFTCATVVVSNTDASLHRTLRALRQLSQRDYAAVLQTARYETSPSPQLTASLAYALSKQGLLGERLFAYAQPYGSEGLLPHLADSTLFFDLPRAVGAHLGYRRGDHTPVPLFLEAVARRPNAQPAARHYRLCALLLQRRTSDFRHLLLQGDTLSVALPLHYREALLLEQQLHPQSADTLPDADLARQFHDFDSLRRLPGTAPQRELRQHFPDTYWTYYYCGK